MLKSDPFTRFTWLKNQPFSDLITSGVAALVVGLGSSAAVLLFKQAIRIVQQFLYSDLPGHLVPSAHWLIVLFPAAGGLIVGLLRKFAIGPEKYAGVAGIMEAVALGGGRLQYHRMPAKAVTAALSIGSGASVGPEDPSVQIGASFGSMVGQLTHMSEERTKILVATGAAAGIATAFNAPIAGVFFATELILGELTTSSFGIVVSGAVLASALTRALQGTNPAFPVPAYALNSPWELPLYMGLGIVTALVSVAYIAVIYHAHDSFQKSHIPDWVRPVPVGVIIGLIGLYFPQILGDSHEATGTILQGLLPSLGVMGLLLILKMGLTALSLGAGFMGGVFAPSLFLGVVVGSAYGTLMDALFPSLAIQPSAFGLVGMAAVLAGTVRTPITAIMLLFEMTNDYRIILPLMFAVVLSVAISELLEHDSVYTLNLARKGIRLYQGRSIDLLDTLTVADIMQKTPPTLSPSLPIKAVSAIFMQTHAHGLPVVDRPKHLYGIMTLQDLETALQQEKSESLQKSVAEVCTCKDKMVVAYPDETIGEVLRHMGNYDIGHLPVVLRADSRHLIGWIDRSDITRAYDAARIRQATLQRRKGMARLETLSGIEIVEFTVTPGAHVDGKRLDEIAWPQGCLVASIQRKSHLIIPKGQTCLYAGDRLAIVATSQDTPRLHEMTSIANISQEGTPLS